MSIIVPSDFKGENTIAQVAANVGGVTNTVQVFIDKYEPKFLKELLGTTLALEFINGLIPVPVDPPTDPITYEPIDPKWTALRDETDLKPMLIDYIYYWYIRNEVTSTAGMGEVKGKTDNATRTSSTDKLCRAWNEMSQMARFFDLSTTVYPDFKRQYWRNVYSWFYGCGISDIFYPINNSNI